MKRCTACFRYSMGQPTFCTGCGRSFDHRICSRGHANPRGVRFCAQCGSGELSTATPPATLMFHFTGWVLRLLIVSFFVLAIGIAAIGLAASLDWSQIGSRLVMLGILLGLVYWTTTLVPGPVKKVGKKAVGMLKDKRKHG